MSGIRKGKKRRKPALKKTPPVIKAIESAVENHKASRRGKKWRAPPPPPVPPPLRSRYGETAGVTVVLRGKQGTGKSRLRQTLAEAGWTVTEEESIYRSSNETVAFTAYMPTRTFGSLEELRAGEQRDRELATAITNAVINVMRIIEQGRKR